MDPAKVKALIDALTAQPVDPDAVTKAATDLLGELAGAGGAPSTDSTPPPPPDGATESADPVPPAPGAAGAYTASKLAKTLGFKSDEAMAKGYLALQASVEALAADKADAELGARRDMITELVKLGFETPATAWEGEAEKRLPCKRLGAEPVADMRARLVALRASRPAVRTLEAPEGTADVADEVAKLSKNELKAIKAKGMTPEEFVEAKANAVRRIGS